MKRAVLVLSTLVLIFPMYFMVAGSFMPLSSIIALPPRLLPDWPPYLDNYRFYLDGAGLAKVATVDLSRAKIEVWAANTAAVLAVAILASASIIFLAAYSFAFLPWRGKRWAYLIFIAGMVVPANVLFVSRFVTFWHLGLVGTRVAMALTQCFTPFHLILARNYLSAIPKDLRDAARIDGCGEAQTLARVIAPICQPVLGVVALQVSMGVLSDYLWQGMMAVEVAKETLLVGLLRLTMRFQTLPEHNNGIGVGLAGGVILMVPMLVVFLFWQRYFSGGLTNGALRE